MQNADTMNVTTPNDREIRITRVFDAPRNAVWKAMSRPELLKRWLLGPPGWEMVKCEDDQRVGGGFLWAWRGQDGQQFSMRGIYREVVPGQRVVRTEVFDFPGSMPPMAEQLATLELADDGVGGTLLTLTVAFPSKQARDAAVASGMESGVSAGHDRLAEILAAGDVSPAAGGAR